LNTNTIYSAAPVTPKSSQQKNSRKNFPLFKTIFSFLLFSFIFAGKANASTATITASSTSLCGPGSVTLTASDNSSHSGTYTWYNASTKAQLATGSTYTVSLSATTSFYVKYSYSSGTDQSSTVTITVNSLPATTFSVSAATVNAGTAVTAKLTSTYNSNDTYTWSFDGGTSSSTGTQQYSVSWSTPGVKTISLIESNSSGCADTTYQQVTVGGLNVTASNYAFSQTITLNTSVTGISSTLYSFPALVYIKEDALKTGVNCANNVQYPTGNGPLASGATAPNYDFAFTANGSTTELFYEVDTYDPVHGILLAWVQIPKLTSTNTTLNFYFGSLSPGHSKSFSQATWSSDYLAVYHFSEGSNTATVIDATSNGRNAIQANTTIINDEIHIAAGIPVVGGAYSFNGTSSSIIQAYGSNPDITGTFTISAWVHYNGGSTSDNKIVSDELNFGYGYKLSVKDPVAVCSSLTNAYIETETRNPSDPVPGNLYDAGIVNNSTWTYIQGEYTGSSFVNYLNGALQSQSCNSGSPSAPQPGNVLAMGLDHGSGTGTGTYPNENFYNGYMDEVRVSTQVKSADWVKEEYYNQSNPLTYTTCGNTITENATYAAALGVNGNTAGSIVYTWNGSASTNPATATNWTSSEAGNPTKLPPFDGTCSLDIPAGLSNYPVLTASESIYGLTLENGAQLNLNGYTLSVGCHIYNNSTTGGQILYGNASGGVTWDGALATQYYYGGTASYMTVGNMTVNNSAGGTVQLTGGGASLYNTLTLTKGNLYVNNSGGGALTLMSSSSGSAAVAAIPSSYSVTGMLNVQRYMSGNSLATYRSYRLMSSPVNAISPTSSSTNYISFGTLNSTYTVNGTTYYGAFTAGSGTGFSFVNRNPTIYLYDEALNPTAATKNAGFTTGKNVGLTSISGTNIGLTSTLLSTTSAQVPVGNGFILFFIGSTNGRSTSNPESTLPDNATVTNVGYLNQQNIPVNLWYTPTGGSTGNLSYTSTELATNFPGYNMIGNPYASTIDLQKLYTDNYNSSTNNISSNFYELYDVNPKQTYVVYSATGGNSGSLYSEYVVSGQGFMTVAQATGQSLTFKEDQKVSALTTTPLDLSLRNNTTNAGGKFSADSIKTAALVIPTDTLQGLHMKLQADSVTYDECGIYFSKNCKDDFDGYDAYDLDGINPTVFLSSFTADGKRVALNKMGDYSKGKRVKLYVSATTDGLYSLNLEDIESIDTTDYKIFLIDNSKNDSLDMTLYHTYNFNFTVADTAAYHNRFVLALERKPMPPYELLTFNGEKANNAIQLKWKTANEGDFTGFALQKQQANGQYITIDSLQSSSASNYGYLDANPLSGANIYRLLQNNINGQVSYAGPITVDYNATSATGAFSVYPNPSKDIVNVTLASSSLSSPTYMAKIYNLAGQVVDSRTVSANSWTQVVSSYKPGVYIIELTTTNGDLVGRAKFLKIN
jgi:trimeric autotransporter adhesin